MARRTSAGRWRVVLGTGVGILLALLVLIGGTVAVTSQPAFCNSCHLMNTRYVSWKRSSHEPYTNCISCHTEPGLVNELKTHLAASRYLWVLFTGRQSGAIIRGTAYTSACLECHALEEMPETIPGANFGGIVGHVPAHRAHLDFEVDCTDCHYRPTLHGEEVLVPMEVCVDCHLDRDIFSANCRLCHNGPGLPGAGLNARSIR